MTSRPLSWARSISKPSTFMSTLVGLEDAQAVELMKELQKMSAFITENPELTRAKGRT